MPNLYELLQFQYDYRFLPLSFRPLVSYRSRIVKRLNFLTRPSILHSYVNQPIPVLLKIKKFFPFTIQMQLLPPMHFPLIKTLGRVAWSVISPSFSNIFNPFSISLSSICLYLAPTCFKIWNIKEFVYCESDCVFTKKYKNSSLKSVN